MDYCCTTNFIMWKMFFWNWSRDLILYFSKSSFSPCWDAPTRYHDIQSKHWCRGRLVWVVIYESLLWQAFQLRLLWSRSSNTQRLCLFDNGYLVAEILHLIDTYLAAINYFNISDLVYIFYIDCLGDSLQWTDFSNWNSRCAWIY